MNKLTDFELHALYAKAFSDKSAEGIVTAGVAALRAIESAATEPLLQRIAELERQLEEALKDAEPIRRMKQRADELIAAFENAPEGKALDMQKGQS